LHRRRRVAEDRVKVDDRIEFATRANPIVNGLPQLLTVRARRRGWLARRRNANA